jgi:hypothetical protein
VSPHEVGFHEFPMIEEKKKTLRFFRSKREMVKDYAFKEREPG